MLETTVSVPASTANLGPGFDCLALALGLRNEITLFAAESGLHVRITGEGSGSLPRDGENLVARAANLAFDELGHRPAGLVIEQVNRIPVGSGLGSSAAAAVGGIFAANALVEGDLSMQSMLQLAVEMEGHADNVAAALFGGLLLVNREDERWCVQECEVKPITVVVSVPEFALSTREARAALPEQVSLQDAVFNVGRLGLLLRALGTADYELLAVGMQDRLHEVHRIPLVPGMERAIRAARLAGAAAVSLSGAGPGLAAYASEAHLAIGRAMQNGFQSAGVKSRYWLLPVDLKGAELSTRQVGKIQDLNGMEDR